MITGTQIAGARGLLRISKAELAEKSTVGLSTIKSFESLDNTPHTKNINKIRDWLTTQGIVFAFDDDGVEWVGVKPKEE